MLQYTELEVQGVVTAVLNRSTLQCWTVEFWLPVTHSAFDIGEHHMTTFQPVNDTAQ